MNCTLQRTGQKDKKRGREFKCAHPGCERVVWLPYSMPQETIDALRVPCQLAVKNPSVLEKALSYTAEYARWVAHGKPTRTVEQIEANQAICEACEFYRAHPKKPNRGNCKLCSCRLNKDESKLNKHYMGTTNCPYPLSPKWLPIVDIQGD